MHSKFPFPVVIDSTQLASFSECEARFSWEYGQHYKPKVPSPHLHAGGAYARGLEMVRKAFYEEELPWERALDAGETALREYWGDFTSPLGSVKTLDRTIGALRYYVTEAFPITKEYLLPYYKGSDLAVEVSFAVPLEHQRTPDTGEPIIIAGRFDQIVRYKDSIYNLDDKTTTRLGATWSEQWATRGQFMLYAWAMRQEGIPVTGTCIRGLCFYKDRYGHAEAFVFHPDDLLNRWEHQMNLRIERMKEAWVRDDWGFAYNSTCSNYGGCTYRDVCLTEDPRPWLEANYEKRVWNPLTTQEETPSE